MHPPHHREGSVGNTAPAHGNFQGIHVPIPWEDIEWAPDHGHCRAASNSAAGDQQVTCAGEQSHKHLSLPTLTLGTHNKSARDTTLVPRETKQDSGSTRSDNFDLFTPPAAHHGPLLGAPGPEVISIQGGGKSTSRKAATKHKGMMEPSYASTTE